MPFSVIENKFVFILYKCYTRCVIKVDTKGGDKMAKKYRRVNAIMDYTFSGDVNEDVALKWDARCLAEYFFFSYYDKDEYEMVTNSNDEYIHGNTKMEVKYISKIIRTNNDKIKYRRIKKEYITVYKRSYPSGIWIDIITTDNMDELCLLFELMNE